MHAQQPPSGFILHKLKITGATQASKNNLVTSVGKNLQDEATTLLWG